MDNQGKYAIYAKRKGQIYDEISGDDFEKKKAFRSAWFLNSVLGWSYLVLLLVFILLLKVGCQLEL